MRVTADDGQRIVGVQISSDHVGEVLRALGIARTVRDPAEIFNGILLVGEEIRLTAGLKLRRGNIHREPAIELCGAQPAMFATLRKLGLTNEQIAWRQRFFVPTEEERGIAIITALTKQFPVIAAEDGQAEWDLSSEIGSAGADPAQLVDLQNWVIEPVNLLESVDEPPPDPMRTPASETLPSEAAEEAIASQVSGLPTWLTVDQASSPAMLHTLPHARCSSTIQLGFNFFAKSES